MSNEENIFRERMGRAIASFLFTHRFYYEVLSRFNFLESDETDTAASKIGRQGVLILINSDYFSSLSEEDLKSILEHEVLHICFKHPLRKKDMDERIFNAACDIAVNELISHVPPEAVTWDRFFSSAAVERRREAEYYYGIIKLILKQNKISDEDLDTQDDHSFWHDETGEHDISLPEVSDTEGQGKEKDSEEESEISLAGQEAVIDRIFMESMTASEGELPGSIEGTSLLELYRDKDYSFKKSWKKLFQDSVQRHLYRQSLRKIEIKPSKKRPNKKLGYPFPSLRVHPRPGARILIVIDTSGSVTENRTMKGISGPDSTERDMVNAFFHEVNCLCNREIDIDLAFADCEVFDPDMALSEPDESRIGSTLIERFRELALKLNFRHGVVHNYTPVKQEALIEFMALAQRINTIGGGFVFRGISGGTSYVPAMDMARELKPRPDLVVYFTDGNDDGALSQGDIPLIFVLSEKAEDFYPWARSILIDDIY